MTIAVAEPESPAAPAPASGRARGELLVAAAVALVALGTYLWQLSVPEQVSFYDSGVYLAAALHLVSGALPYRDFTFVQPPGLLYLLAPVALLSRVVGTHDGLTVGRALTSFVTAANCALTALLVRRHGRFAMAVAGTALALSPVAFLVSSAIKLEPYCMLFVLVGMLVVLGRGEVAALSQRGALVAGTALGVAGLVKIWAFFPFLALVALLAMRARHRLIAFVAGAGAVFLVGVAPFLATAPGAFVREVVLEQVGRRANPSDSAPLLWRLRALTGYLNTLVAPSTAVAVLALAVLGLLVVVGYRRWRTVADADALLLFGALAVVAMLLVSPETYTYYDYFAQPFLLGLAVVALWRVGALVAPRLPRPALTSATRRFVTSSAVAALALAAGALVLYTTSFFSAYAFFYGAYGRWIDPITRIVPAGACVVYTEVSFGVYANRVATSDPRCPDVVDIDGEWMAHGYQLVPPTRSFSDQWRGYFARAQYVVFSGLHPDDVPWDRSLDQWFERHFHLIYARNYVFIYQAGTASGG